MRRLALLLTSALIMASCGGLGEGPYSVWVVGGVDATTAASVIGALEDGGFEGFVDEGSDDEGYVVHRPGLAEWKAEALAGAITESGTWPAVRVFRSSQLPGLPQSSGIHTDV